MDREKKINKQLFHHLEKIIHILIMLNFTNYSKYHDYFSNILLSNIKCISLNINKSIFLNIVHCISFEFLTMHVINMYNDSLPW